MAARQSTLEWAVKRDRQLALGGLIAVIASCWAYLLVGAGMDMGNMSAVMGSGWTIRYFLLVLTMWWVMMLAMMLPSAAPTILLYAALARSGARDGQSVTPTGVFAAGYAIAWGVFSLAATALQWRLEESDLLDSMMQSTSVPLGAALLIGAGVYQLTPLKQACLRHCRSPIEFLGRRWQSGAVGALSMGIEHGLFCLGCCWVLMGLLFYAGVMNLVWIGVLALYVMLEKLAPAGHWIGHFGGIALIIWGATTALIHL